MSYFNTSAIAKKFKYAISGHKARITTQVCVFIIYILISIGCYFYASYSLTNRKNEILNSYYSTIHNYAKSELKYLLQKSPIKQQDSLLSVNVSDIQYCYDEQCVKTDLFKFTSIIDKYIPEFVYYKVEINKQLLHINTKVDKYELIKKSYITSSNLLSIALSLDPKYWNKVRFHVIIPFLFTFISSTLLFMSFILSINRFSQSARRYYDSYYQKYYDAKIEKLATKYKEELIAKENMLLKQIWDLEYSKEKDAEFNYLFFQEANKLAMSYDNIHILRSDNNQDNKFLPCPIVLFYNSEDREQVDIKNLIRLFSDRFTCSTDNVLISIVSSEQSLYFVSRASLYQIIYSIIIYLYFILKEQTKSVKYCIKLNIMRTESDNIKLLFEYDGLPLHKENDVLKLSSRFLKKYSSPFILSLSQIFDILKANNFHCIIGYENFNYVEIKENVIISSDTAPYNNVIKLSNLRK